MALVALVAGCAGGAPIGGRTIDDTFAVNSAGWDNGAALILFFGVHEVQGRVAVCGAYTLRGDTAVTSDLNGQVMEGASVELDGTSLVQGLQFMLMTSCAGAKFDDYAGRLAACRLTGTAWQPGYAGATPAIRIPRMRFVI